MTADEVEKKVTDYIKKIHAESGSSNDINVEMCHGGLPWVADIKDPNFQAGRFAIKEVNIGTFISFLKNNFKVYKVEPDFTREGGSIPITLTFQEATKKNVCLLPLGMADDGAHSQNEKFNRKNYINGTKCLAAYTNNLAKLGRGETLN